MTPKYVVEKPNTATLQSSPSVGAVARGFGQTFGILPSMAFLTLVVDAMLFPVDALSLGTDLPISCTVGAIVGLITYRAQRKWYGDDQESAALKGAVLGLLTAIPTALPAILYVPSGIVGLVHGRRGK